MMNRLDDGFADNLAPVGHSSNPGHYGCMQADSEGITHEGMDMKGLSYFDQCHYNVRAETNFQCEPDYQFTAFDTYSPPWTLFVIPSLVSNCMLVAALCEQMRYVALVWILLLVWSGWVLDNIRRNHHGISSIELFSTEHLKWIR